MSAQTSAQRQQRQKRKTGGKGAVVRMTDATERIHRSVAGFPLDLLEAVDALKKPVARVRRLQERSIQATYEFVRGIEREIAGLARDASGRRKAKRKATRKAAHPKRAARVVRGAEAHARPVHPAAARQAS